MVEATQDRLYGLLCGGAQYPAVDFYRPMMTMMMMIYQMRQLTVSSQTIETEEKI